MEFTADKTWLTIIACVLGCLWSIGRWAGATVTRVLPQLANGVWFSSGRPEQADGATTRLGAWLPARCPVRRSSSNDGLEPRRRDSLRGWQSDGR